MKPAVHTSSTMRTNALRKTPGARAAIVAIALAAGLAACGDKAAPGAKPADAAAASAPSLADAASPAAARKAQEDAVKAALPKANKATPSADYTELSSGHQVMFAYLALAAMPIDYKEIAERFSQDYSRAGDEFRKNDLLTALKPKIDGEVSKAGARRYLKMTIDNPIEKYDFDKKGFPVQSGIWEAGSYRYFNDNGSYKLGFSNGETFRYLDVAAEDSARAIENLRGKYEPLRLVVYCFTQDADVSNKTIKAEIVKVELIDKRGNVLASK